jgi:hypothetical protein
MKKMFDFKPETRRWIYGVIAGLVPLFITLGYLSPELAKDYLALAAAVLTVGGSALAIKNVPDEE